METSASAMEIFQLRVTAVDWAMAKAEEFGAGVDVPEITDTAAWESECLDKRKMCLMAGLPHLIDGGAAARNRYIDSLKELAKKASRKGAAVAWFDASAQPDVASAFNMGVFPGIVAINKSKMRYSLHLGAFDAKHLNSAWRR